MLLWLLVALIALFAFRSAAQNRELSNINLLQPEIIEQEEGETAGGRIRCCNKCGPICNLKYPGDCQCSDPDREGTWVPDYACSPGCVNNVLVTDQTLASGDSLRFGAHVLEMQRDCNLVLSSYLGGITVVQFATHTAGNGQNCSLSFMEDGRLAVVDFFSNGNKTIWISPNQSNAKGRYAAILRPNGEFAIYGPIVWTPRIPRPNTREGEQSAATASQNAVWPQYNNVLFSGESLFDGDALQIPYSRFELDKCNLALITGIPSTKVWESNTYSTSRSCLARLTDHGQLSVVNGLGETVWSSSPEPLPRKGEYALVLEGNPYFGHVVIYGRKSWSTTSDQAEESSVEGIRMVTAE